MPSTYTPLLHRRPHPSPATLCLSPWFDGDGGGGFRRRLWWWVSTATETVVVVRIDGDGGGGGGGFLTETVAAVVGFWPPFPLCRPPATGVRSWWRWGCGGIFGLPVLVGFC
ncbi:hypothetical protein Hdeb2414_s0006g00217531 [Helianthus debilis subsp. tardiflorus]